MITEDNIIKKVAIEYPCRWNYKIIGKDKDKLENSILNILKEKYEYTFYYGHSSKTEKFHSFNINCKVNSEKDRLDIFNLLQNNIDIKIVI